MTNDDINGLKVSVIAFTSFNRVPKELLPNEENKVSVLKQDEGTSLERLIETAGRTCYDSFGKGRSSEDYHRHIKEVGHGSVTEHASISFFISGVSRALTHEFVRHRVGTAISQRSTRYVNESESSRCFHPILSELLEKDVELDRIIEESISASNLAYKKTFEKILDYLLDKGVSKDIATKQARGAARGLLENCLETEMVWTVNIRELRNILIQRASDYADAEIRVLANKLYEAAILLCPAYFDDFVKKPSIDGIGYVLESKFGRI